VTRTILLDIVGDKVARRAVGGELGDSKQANRLTIVHLRRYDRPTYRAVEREDALSAARNEVNET
jgi:hypothetical protein